jgi:hypothetical protein
MVGPVCARAKGNMVMFGVGSTLSFITSSSFNRNQTAVRPCKQEPNKSRPLGTLKVQRL